MTDKKLTPQIIKDYFMDLLNKRKDDMDMVIQTDEEGVKQLDELMKQECQKLKKQNNENN